MHGQSRRTFMGLLGFYCGQPLFHSRLPIVAEQRCLPSSRITWTVIMVVEGLAVRNWRGVAIVILYNVLLVYRPSPHPPSCIAHCMLRTQKRHLEPWWTKKGHLEPWWTKKGPPDGKRAFWGATGLARGSPDGPFPIRKVTSLALARIKLNCTWEKNEERMITVNGKPYLRMRIRIRVFVFLLEKWQLLKNSYPCLGKSDNRPRRRRRIRVFVFLLEKWQLLRILIPALVKVTIVQQSAYRRSKRHGARQRLARWPFSYWKNDIFGVDTIKAKMHTRKKWRRPEKS